MIQGMTAPLQGPVSMSMPFAPESASHVRQALGSWLGHRGSAPHVVDDARLVATELIGNAVKHASPLDNGTVLVQWQEEDAALVLSVCDGGGPTEPQQLESEPYDIDGRGLTIVNALSSAWWVEHATKLHTVRVRLPLD